MECIRRKISCFLVLILLFTVSVTGCGMTAGSKESSSSEVTERDTKKKQDVTSEKEEVVTESIQEVPVYGKKQKKKIQKYLAGLPDDYLGVQEACNLGMIMRSSALKQEEQESFDKKWLDFFDDIKRITCPTGEQRAAVIVEYTMEGDPIYTYLSYIDGEYFCYVDDSRDSYRADGEKNFSGSYQSLRQIVEKEEEEKTIEFYLVNDLSISDKKLKEEINSPEFEVGKKIWLLYIIK